MGAAEDCSFGTQLYKPTASISTARSRQRSSCKRKLADMQTDVALGLTFS